MQGVCWPQLAQGKVSWRDVRGLCPAVVGVVSLMMMMMAVVIVNNDAIVVLMGGLYY